MYCYFAKRVKRQTAQTLFQRREGYGNAIQRGQFACEQEEKVVTVSQGSLLNVWEWCSDLYNYNYYSTLSNIIADNPKGPEISFDPNEPYSEKRVIRGGSYLCSKSYCTGYRNSMRMKSTPDTGSMHTGFRTVKDIDI